MGVLKAHIHMLCLEQVRYPHIKDDVLTLGLIDYGNGEMCLLISLSFLQKQLSFDLGPLGFKSS